MMTKPLLVMPCVLILVLHNTELQGRIVCCCTQHSSLVGRNKRRIADYSSFPYNCCYEIIQYCLGLAYPNVLNHFLLNISRLTNFIYYVPSVHVNTYHGASFMNTTCLSSLEYTILFCCSTPAFRKLGYSNFLLFTGTIIGNYYPKILEAMIAGNTRKENFEETRGNELQKKSSKSKKWSPFS